MKTNTCKNCTWIRGVTSIGAGYCAFRNTMVFDTDPGCNGQWYGQISETWVSYGETGEPGDKTIGIFWNKPVFSEHEKRFFDIHGGEDCKAEFEFVEDPKNIIKALLPPIDIIKGTKKLLRVTINIIDQ